MFAEYTLEYLLAYFIHESKISHILINSNVKCKEHLLRTQET